MSNCCLLERGPSTLLSSSPGPIGMPAAISASVVTTSSYWESCT